MITTTYTGNLHRPLTYKGTKKDGGMDSSIFKRERSKPRFEFTLAEYAPKKYVPLKRRTFKAQKKARPASAKKTEDEDKAMVARWIIRKLDGGFQLAFTGLGAFVFAQFPNFLQHYMQRLGGQLQEDRHIIKMQQGIAGKYFISVDQNVEQLLKSSDPHAVDQGRFIQSIIARENDLAYAQQALSEAGPFSRAFIWVRHLDLSVAKATFKEYIPGITANTETALYAVAGVVTGIGIYYILTRALPKLVKSTFALARSP